MITHYVRGHIRMSQATADKMRAFFKIIITDVRAKKNDTVSTPN
jgi:hypothetical protein